MEQPKGIVDRVKDALGITGAPTDRDPPPIPLPDRDIAFEGDAGIYPPEDSLRAARDLETERLRREVGEYPREKSAIERNAESARREDGE